MAFAVLVSLIAGAASGAVTGGITAAFAPPPVAVAVGLSALAVFAVAPPSGWLQGERRFARYAVVSIMEVALRLVFSVVAIVVGWGTPAALLGFAVGALALVCGPVALARDLAWRPNVLRERWRWSETGGIAVTQFVVSALVGADVVMLALVGDGSVADAGYQALSTLAKGPVYVAAGTVLVVFPLLAALGANVDDVLAAALRSFGKLAVLAAIALATVPADLVMLVLPAQYADSLALLPWLAAAGFGYAAVTVLVTMLLGLRAYGSCLLALLVAAVVIPAGMAIGWSLGGPRGLAVGSAAGALAATVALAAIAAPLRPPGIATFAVRGAAIGAALLGLLVLTRPYPAAWIAVMTVAGAGVLGIAALLRRRVAAWSGWIVGVSVGLVALGARAIGLTRANDLFIDELTYADFAQQVATGHLPNVHGTPFFLHPPASMALGGLIVETFGLTGSAMDVAYDLRWVNAVLGAVMVVLAFFIVRRVVNLPVAAATAMILALDPFVLRNDSRVMIETPAVVLLLAGTLALLAAMDRSGDRQADRHGRLLDVLAGLLLGGALVTKDMTVVPGVAAVLLAVLWRRTVAPRTALRVGAAASVPYLCYLAVVFAAGQLPAWIAAKTSGVLRMVGVHQTTGFNAVSGVSLSERLIAEVPRFGTSYLILALCVPAGIVAAYSRTPGRRLIGIIAISTGLLGVYAVAAGAAEEQFGYYVLVMSVLALAVSVAEVVERRPGLRRLSVAACGVFVALTAVLGISARFVIDDGYLQARTWIEAHVAVPADVGVTGVTAEFAFPEFDVSPSLAALRDNHDEYVLTASRPLVQGYGYASPELLDWLHRHAHPVFDAAGPTNGHVVVWRLDRAAVASAVESGMTIPPVSSGLA
jgi:O-antigen/teichoic acid export membrane protein